MNVQIKLKLPSFQPTCYEEKLHECYPLHPSLPHQRILRMCVHKRHDYKYYVQCQPAMVLLYPRLRTDCVEDKTLGINE